MARQDAFSIDAPFSVVETSIADLRAALDSGVVTSVDLAVRYLNRIARYDRHGILLNSVPVLNPDLFDDARASDERRADGELLGPLDGILYTAKDSYSVRGLTVAAGSPAFAELIAGHDAFTISRLRAAGAVLIGLTNMPPMANGGMQRGLYGRAESPYNADFLTSAFGSGSSNGSGTATAACFGAFGLGEETWSSGRAPASNNALVAYTPSRGVISTRGNWPLVPTMDVVVPHTRSVADLLEVLDAIVADDADVSGDLWRSQPWITLPKASEVRPESYPALQPLSSLAGIRFGVLRMYINSDDGATAAIETHPDVIALWRAIRSDLEELGAEVIEVDFPVVSNYEGDRPDALSMVDRGFVPADFATREIEELSILAWDDFLQTNGDPTLFRLADVDGPRIFPKPTGALPDRYGDADFDLADYVTMARGGVTPLEDIPSIEAGMRGLESTRKVDFEDWLDELGLDAVVFPAVADIGPADADVNPESAALAWRNGTWVANGNLVPRHLGIPTLTIPMGTMATSGMPVGLTIAGKSSSDIELLRFGSTIEASRDRRVVPPRTPALPDEATGAPVSPSKSGEGAAPSLELDAELSESADGRLMVSVSGTSDAAELTLFVNGEWVGVSRHLLAFSARRELAASVHSTPHSEWRGPYGTIVIAMARSAGGVATAKYLVVGGTG